MKKLLIVSDTPTHPVSGGNRACILQNVDLLRNMGFDIYFLYVHNYDAPEADIDEATGETDSSFIGCRRRSICTVGSWRVFIPPHALESTSSFPGG